MDFLFLLHSTEKKGNISLWSLATLEGFPAWATWIKSPQRNWFNLNFFFWSHQNGRVDIPLQDFLLEDRIPGFINYCKFFRSWSSQAAPDHCTTTIIWLLIWCSVYEMLCSFTADATGLKPSNIRIFWSSDTLKYDKMQKTNNRKRAFFTAL